MEIGILLVVIRDDYEIRGRSLLGTSVCNRDTLWVRSHWRIRRWMGNGSVLTLGPQILSAYPVMCGIQREADLFIYL